jgi:hypothetical protein
MVFPRHYLADCFRHGGHAGRQIGQNDSVNNSSDGSKLNVSRASTERPWKESFTAEWRKHCAMYRGEPPAWYLANCGEAVAKNIPRASLECAMTVIGCAFGARTRCAGDPHAHVAHLGSKGRWAMSKGGLGPETNCSPDPAPPLYPI